MAAAAVTATPESGVRSRWIIGRGVDLSLVVGSAGAGYVYLALFTIFHAPLSYMWWFWSVGFDGTHIFGTASRTYFDAEARARHSKLLYGSLLFFFAAGPVMALMGLKGWLALIVGAWAYYHVIRQHYGFMILYKVKNHDLAKLDNSLDRWFLGVMTIFPPFLRFFVRNPAELGMPFKPLTSIEPFCWALVAVVGAAYVARQVMRWRGGEAANVPKYLLLGGVIPLHWLTFMYLGWQAAVPTVTIVHNLQYHALIWFHNRNRYAEPGAEREHGRIPSAVGRSLLAYAAVALVFSALYRIPGFQLGKVSDLAFGFFAGFGLTHYYLDSRIWRVRHDPGLREALQLA
jgi:hypothetical protein